MDERNQRQPDQDPKAPAKLVVGLKGLHKEHIFVPTKVDESILNAAREQLGETHQESRPSKKLRHNLGSRNGPPGLLLQSA